MAERESLPRSNKPPAKAGRKDRLAEALRENLVRRKAQKKARIERAGAAEEQGQ